MKNVAATSLLARSYLGGLAHVHTKLSNQRWHKESDQTVASYTRTLNLEGLTGHSDSPFRFIMINEHGSNPAKPKLLDPLSLRARALLRQRWKATVAGVPILYGFEASLLPDGSTDLSARLAEHCEMVIASKHGTSKQLGRDPRAIMRMFELACRNPSIDVIGHPLRDLEDIGGVDWPKIFEEAAATGTAIEVNLNNFPLEASEPERWQKWRAWLRELEISGAGVFLGVDLHNYVQLRRFVENWRNLDKGDGRNVLAACFESLAELGIRPDRVVNAKYDSFKAWLALPKAARVAPAPAVARAAK